MEGGTTDWAVGLIIGVGSAALGAAREKFLRHTLLDRSLLIGIFPFKPFAVLVYKGTGSLLLVAGPMMGRATDGADHNVVPLLKGFSTDGAFYTKIVGHVQNLSSRRNGSM